MAKDTAVKKVNRKRKIMVGSFLNKTEFAKLEKITEKNSFETSSRTIRFLITNYILK